MVQWIVPNNCTGHSVLQEIRAEQTAKKVHKKGEGGRSVIQCGEDEERWVIYSVGIFSCTSLLTEQKHKPRGESVKQLTITHRVIKL